MRAVRLLSAAVLAVACVTCAEQPLSRTAGYARIPLAPNFAVAPVGGPSIDVTKIRGVLHGTTDSSVAEGAVEGDSAILEFQGVIVKGDSSLYSLTVTAFDAANVAIFQGDTSLQVKPGDNAPATPDLDYVAPDTLAATINISVDTLVLSWAGASTGANSCLNKIPDATKKVDSLLTVTGKTAGNANVTNVRVGWTSRDETAVTVDSSGRVRSQCANKGGWLVARTFTNKADSIFVSVNAPAFSLTMTPDSTDLRRASTVQLNAQVVDETGHAVTASAVSWFSSDVAKATVNSSGLVTGVSNGRVLITASSGNRTTVGIVQVIRPLASKVIALPAITLDSLGIGQSRSYFAKALDASNKIIPEATGFAWTSTSPASATINASTGLATAVAVGSPKLIASLDGKADTLDLTVLTSMPPGSIKGKFTSAADGSALATASLVSGPNNTTTAGDGTFTIAGLQQGDSVIVSKTGFVTAVAYNVPAFPGKTLEVPSASLSPTGGSGNITGLVKNAVTGSVVSGITVKAYKGINAGPSPRHNAAPDYTATTDGTGTFTIPNALAGNYTLVYGSTGYSETFASANSVSGVTKTVGDALVAPAAAASGLYILLTWGSASANCATPANNIPCDLDAHLTGPLLTDSTQRFQVFSGSLRYIVGNDTIAALDASANNGRGPEILSIRPSAPVASGPSTRYHFYVHNASGNNMALADSASARVDVYQDGRLIGTYFPPSGQTGNLWNVFDYDGARLLPIGTITTTATPAVLAMRTWNLPADVAASVLRVRALSLVEIVGQR
jgi:hypothetical protein